MIRILRAWTTSLLVMAAAIAAAQQPPSPSLEEVYERWANDETVFEQEVRSRIADAKTRGDLRAELLAIRDLAAVLPPELSGPSHELVQAVAQARSLGDPSLESALATALALALVDEGRRDEALEMHRQAVALAERSGDADIRINAYFEQGMYWFTGSDDQALPWLDRALTLSAQRQERARQAVVLLCISRVLRQSELASAEELAAAEAHQVRAMSLIDSRAHGRLLSAVLSDIGTTKLRQEKWDDALSYLGRALPLAPESDLATINVRLAQVNMKQDRLDAALDHLQKALSQKPNPLWKAYALINYARVQARLGNPQAARQALEQARELTAASIFPKLELDFFEGEAEVAAARGDHALAYQLSQRRLEGERKLYMSNAAKRVEELSVTYKLKLREADNELLKAGQAASESKRTTLALALVLLAMALVGAVTFFVLTLRQHRRVELLALEGARQAERERIARDLHDTLLQSTQGLILRVQAASDTMAPDDPVRRALEDTLQRADDVLAEGRDRVTSLREASAGPGDLRLAILAAADGLPRAETTRLLVASLGTPSTLYPMVAEEAQWIAREALSNAFQHANARSVDVQLIHGDTAFRVCIHDDGDGMTPAAAAGDARPGHWGVKGMQERARAIGGTLDVRSRPGEGTTVELSVPADRAYPPAPTASRGGKRSASALAADGRDDA